MKKLGKLKLNVLNEQSIEQKQMNELRGGRICNCSCYFEGKGGASSSNNRDANYNVGDNGGKSTLGCNQYGVNDAYYSQCYTCNECNQAY